MPKELLSEDAEWFQAWKASGIDQEVYLPRYFKQLDLPGGERKMLHQRRGRMVAAYYKKIKTRLRKSTSELGLDMATPLLCLLTLRH